MGKHRPASKSAPTATDLIAQLAATNPSATYTDDDQIQTTEIPAVHDRLPQVPPRLRWAAGLTVAGVAATGLIAADGPATAASPALEPTTTEMAAVRPITPELAAARLGDLAASRAQRDQAQQIAAASQAAADAAELDRQARATAQAAAAKKAKDAAAAQAAQDAARKAAQAHTATVASQAVQGATVTAAAPSRGSGRNAIVPGSTITSGFGTRWGVLHAGVDLAAPLGTPIYTPMSGTVLKAGPATGFGNAIYIQVSNGDVLVFGHMRTMYVHAGQTVSAGTRIALVGSEGESTGPHCHVERHLGGINGTKVDPSSFLGL